MKSLYLILLSIISISSNAQDTLFKHYDNDWNIVQKEKAKFFGTFIKKEASYEVKTYYLPSMKLRGRSNQKDTTLNSPTGLSMSYHQNGKKLDSTFTNEDGKVEYSFRYYPSGKLSMTYFKAVGQKNEVFTGYNEDGTIIKNFIVAKEAEFNGGDKAWHNYLVKNMNKTLSTPKTKKTIEINAKVVILFVINEQGFTTDIKIKESSGNKNVDQDAVRVITNSPKWKNAILYNNPVRVYRIQPLTYILEVDN